MILTTKIVKGIVAEGDKFSTETKLFNKLGFATSCGGTKDAQRKEIQRFLFYEKTHKINPKTHKESNEIIITKIYESALPKVDKRTEKSSNYIDALMPCIQNLNGDFTVAELMKKVGLINDKNVFASDSLSYLIEKSFKEKLISTIKYLEKTTAFSGSEMIYFLSKKGKSKVADESEINRIKRIEELEKQKIEKKYQKPFNQLKHNYGIIIHYHQGINKRVQAEMRYDSCFKGFHIVGINEKNNKADISEFKKLFKEYIGHRILSEYNGSEN